MDIFRYLLQPIAIFAFLGVGYLIIISGRSARKKIGHYSVPDWNFAIKKIWAKYALRRWKKEKRGKDPPLTAEFENPVKLRDESSFDSKSFNLFNPDGSSLYVCLKKRSTRITDVSVILTLSDGTIYQLPNHPDTVFANTNAECWTGGGLRFTVVEPFRKWRITFNGFLSNGIKNDLTDERVAIHVKFNFIWSNVQKPVFNINDWSEGLTAHSLSMESWRHPHWIEMVNQWDIDGYHQFGSAMGEVYFGSELEPQTLYLRGVRVRQWAQFGSSPIRRTLSLQGIAHDGTAYYLHAESYYEGLTQITHGSIRVPCGDQDVLDECDLSLQEFAEFKTYIPDAYSIRVRTGEREFRINIDLESHKKIILRNGQPWEWENIIIPFQGGVNDSYGRGYIHLGYSFFESQPPQPTEKVTYIRELKWDFLQPNYLSKLCVDFSEQGAICPQLVGAKGASLALLHSAPSNKYTVPPGFCLTVSALNAQIDSLDVVKNAIDNLKNIAKKYNEGSMKNACDGLVNLLKVTPVISEVQSTVNIYLDKLRNSIESDFESSDITFAVRSSGIGEDSEELSAAGQNATILGCRTNEDVLRAIQECWASLFTFQSVEYRRQHGQIANCGMGVVIQVVISAQSAGVMFTRHPNTGDPSSILITSNYGLGESVVSGEVEPDTILLSRNYKNNIAIDKIEVGKKTHKVMLKSECQSGGTVNVQLNDIEVNTMSLTEDECLRLGQIAIEQEALWGAPRDIEWAISNGRIYLLQARPITSLDRWTEFELTHEFDTPIMSDEDLMSFANTGEVLPGALTALSFSVIVQQISKSISLSVHPKWKNIWYEEALTVTHSHTGINIMNTLYRHVDYELDLIIKVIEMGIIGHHVIDDNIHSVALRRRPPPSARQNLIKKFDMAKILWNGQKYLDASTYLSKTFHFNIKESDTAEELFKAIDDSLIVIFDNSCNHSNITNSSLFSEFVAISILMEGKAEFSPDHYSDIGKILSSCKDVISADVPNSLTEITTSIYFSGKAHEFAEVPVENAQKWLGEHCPEAAAKLQHFLQKHGHRSIKEFDLATETWGMNPLELLKSLQVGVGIVRNAGPASGKSYPPTPNELVSQLISPKSKISKKLLKIIIPICQKAVCRREASKEALTSLVHKFRMAYIALARKLVNEWYLPEENLIFHLTHLEIKDLIRTRNAGLISKAQQRRRLMPKWENLQFKELNKGYPQPLNSTTEKIELRAGSTENRLIGTPVSPGNVIGRACVVHNLSEIGQLKNGDILITHSTDIGWSPYFPLLSGVVTELGGLISHGAVVAREYGLPCIVGAQGATSVFKTGDTVLLGGTVGFLEKIDSASNGTK